MPDPAKIDLLVVDDDDRFRQMVVHRLRSAQVDVHEASDAVGAWEAASRREFDVAVFDMVMPGMSGLELLEKFKSSGLECEVILLTGRASIESAVQAMRLGAYDYLTKPFSLSDLQKVIEKACQRRELAKENRLLRTLLARSQPERAMIGESPAMQEVFRLVERAGPSDKPILIQGESGTGKELVAGALHDGSSRSKKPMVAINCAAIPETLLESELFGHEKGAFTGATSSKPGMFEVADGGTLFVDEVGEMPVSVQVKLLRVLEDGSMRRLGSIREHRVNVRLLAATNRSLEEQISLGRFREDLYYRINVMALELPPLRDREGDVQRLVHHFLGPDWSIDAHAMQIMEQYRWPGNVRQLINVIERAKILADDPIIRSIDLPRHIVSETTSVMREQPSSNDKLTTLERAKIVEVLQRESGNKTQAAKALGIERRKLYRLLEKYKISPSS